VYVYVDVVLDADVVLDIVAVVVVVLDGEHRDVVQDHDSDYDYV
jgi:hypothetical protein